MTFYLLCSKTKQEDELEQLCNIFKEEVDDKRSQITSQYLQRAATEFPDTLSITTSLDELLLCFSLGGQLKNYYRYGTYSLCAQQREKFWFAVKNGKFSTGQADPDWNNPKDLEQRTRIQEFFKKRVLEEKALGSSEDVWDVRSEPLNKPFFVERRGKKCVIEDMDMGTELREHKQRMLFTSGEVV